jgi:hypothetical protein
MCAAVQERARLPSEERDDKRKIGNCTIGKRRGNPNPDNRLNASQGRSRLAFIINMGRPAEDLVGQPGR